MASIRNRDVTMTDHWYSFGIAEWKTHRGDAFVDVDEYLKWVEKVSVVFFNTLIHAENITFLRLPMTISLRKIMYQPKLFLFCNYFGGHTSFKPMLLKKFYAKLSEIDSKDLSTFKYVDEQYVDHRKKYARTDGPNVFRELKDGMIHTDKALSKHKGFSSTMSCRVMTQLRRVLLDPIEMDLIRKNHCFCFYWTNEEVKTHDAMEMSRFWMFEKYRKKIMA